MNNMIFTYPDFLKLCKLELTGDDEKDLPMVKQKINNLAKQIIDRKRKSMNVSPVKDDEEAKKRITEELAVLKQQVSEICDVSDLYEYIFFYIKMFYGEAIFVIQHMPSDNSASFPERRDKLVKMCEECLAQFSSAADVKYYIDEVVPCIGTIDLGKMSLKDVGEKPEALLAMRESGEGNYSMKVLMNPEPQKIISGQVHNQLVAVYSFGCYQYATPMMSELTPHELLAIVKKDRDGKIEVSTGIMRLRNRKKEEISNTDIIISKIDDNSDRKYVDAMNQIGHFTTTGDPGNHRLDLKIKYDEVQLSDEIKRFLLRVAVSPLILKNARNNNEGFIGDIQEGGTNSEYGNLRLVCNVIGVEELLEFLRVAKTQEVCQKPDGTMVTFLQITEEIEAKAEQLAQRMMWPSKEIESERG